MKNNDEYKNLIARYLNGELSDEDSQNLKAWVKKNSDNQELFYAVKDTWDASLKKELNDSEQLMRFYRDRATSTKKSFLSPWQTGIAIAAVLVLSLLIGNLVPYLNNLSTQSVASFIVPKGSISQLVLTDGTKVNLNSDSRLVVDKDFSASNRVVSLTGEAYFEVKSDSKNPFIINTEKFDVKVTGTKFNVCAYNDVKEISATLSEGKIELTANNKTFELNPGNKIIFDRATMSHRYKKIDTSADIAWTNGNFVFRNIPFTDLAKRLERKFKVEITYPTDALEDMKYTGRFTNNETIEQLLDAIELTSSVSYEKLNNKEYKIISNPM